MSNGNSRRARVFQSFRHAPSRGAANLPASPSLLRCCWWLRRCCFCCCRRALLPPLASTTTKVARSYSPYLHLSSPPTLSHSPHSPLPRCYAPELLCNALQHGRSFSSQRNPLSPPCLVPLLHEPLAALVLEECGTAWGLSASGWQVGGECETAQFIACDANGLVTSM
ncbi:unnamed protein product [Closterium sp. NIES-54]